MNQERVRYALHALALIATMAVGCAAHAQSSYPDKSIRLVVPFPPGGSSDFVARIIAPKFGEFLGQNIVVDNRGGASGTIGGYDVARAAPDGYTLLMVFDSHAVNHHLYKSLKYDTFKSFDYVGQIVSAPMLIAGSRKLPANSLAELIQYAKANPGKVTYGSSGVGGSNHLTAAALSTLAGIKTVHIPYKGGGPMLNAIMSGEIDFVVTTLPVIVGQVKAGMMKPLAIGAKTRVPQLPEVPAATEVLPGYEATSWHGMLAPAGTPKDILARIHQALLRTLNAPEIKAKLEGDGFTIVASSPQEFLDKVRTESERLGRMIKESNITID